MKRFAILVIFVLITGPAFPQDDAKKDAPRKIQDREKTDCSKFRRMEGRDRYDQFKKVLHLFPGAKFVKQPDNTMKLQEGSISFFMSEKELTELLGKPILDHGMLVYNLAPDHCTANFSKTKAGGIYFTSYANCEDKEPVEKN